jgi:hypothetical protein
MEDIVEIIRAQHQFDYASTFDVYDKCASLLLHFEADGIRALVTILDHKSKFVSSLDPMLADLIESIGFYPYLQKEKLELTSPSSLIRMGGNHSLSVSNRIFHDEQKRILDKLRGGENVVVSAPTSFGKSLLIEEMVASNKFRNIVIVQPTLALLDETRRKLNKYRDRYKLILRTSQLPDDKKGNIFILTSERVNEYPSFPSVDFLVIDEFYKLSARRDDERSDSLNNALLYLLKRYCPQFYLAGPNIDRVSQGFLDAYDAKFYHTDYNLVGTDVIDVFSKHPGEFGDRGKKKAHKEKVLFELLDELTEEQTLIYCSSPNRARNLAVAYLSHLKRRGIEPRNPELPIYQWISDNVSPLWSLIDLISNGIGFHDGALQRHITTTIIDYFDSKRIRVVFCTATIIEGVNTNAKNVVYFDQRKGKDKPIDYFDYANIRGRAGRLMEHYIGRVYNFGAPPLKDDIDIDIPFVDQSPIADEILINLDDSAVRDLNSEQFAYLRSFSKAERELFSSNSIYVRGQANLLNLMREQIDRKYEEICWDRMPTYSQLSTSLGMAWDCLLRPEDDLKPMTKDWIIKLTFDYCANQDINAIVKSNFAYNRNQTRNTKKSDAILMDESIRHAFQIMRHWFEYRIPKWLLVVDRMQKFVCAERGLRPGNYVYYATFLENDFVRENMSILAEFGVPRSAIVKLQSQIKPDMDQDEVIADISRRRLTNHPGLTAYEREKLMKALTG